MTDSGPSETRPVAVLRAVSALRSLGVPHAEFEGREVEAGSWFADWTGEIPGTEGSPGSEVYVGLMGGAPDAPSARLLLDDWEFEDVTAEDVGELLRGVFTGAAAITRRRTFPFTATRVLECAVGPRRYSAAKPYDADERPQPWEQPLTSG
ncbi:hypothetical protein [Streptomyces broussonetiae]|uniref:Uncharacterized protein n=1 Tax=Streptomyces broussonetiae TaxID=2686304 RepID=A0ABV5E6G6_9ACTN